MQKKILVGVPPKAHVSLASDEIIGLRGLGYDCATIIYGRNNQDAGVFTKLFATITKAFAMVIELYKFRPHYLYLNSRLEPVAGTRDFISLLIVKCFYFFRLKIIIKSHGSDHTLFLKNSSWYKKLVVPFLRKYVNAWLFLSSEEIELVRAEDASFAKKLFVTPNIIDPSRCHKLAGFNNSFHLPENRYKFLFVGRMTREKGIFEVLESIPFLDFKEKCVFIFVGDGEHFDELKQKSVALNVDHLTFFPGYLPDSECDHFYANTDALIFPTYFTEGFPMALFKSVANGMPVITTRMRAAKDYLQEPANVLWVKEKSPESVAAAVTKLYHDKDLQQRMHDNNIKLGEQFSVEKVSLLMDKIFTSLS